MKLCIPVATPEGLSARPEAAVPNVRYLHIFDLESRDFEEIDLMAQEAQEEAARPAVVFDALACTSIARPLFGNLHRQGVSVFLTEAQTVQAVLEEFDRGEMFQIPDAEAEGGCGGGCSGHGAGGGCHGGGGGCGGGGNAGGCGGHEHGEHEAHACACSAGQTADAAEVPEKPRGDVFKIAVTSQNRKTVTEHAGKCRKFWVYEIRGGVVADKTLLELPIEQTLHESASGEAHPLDDVAVLLTTGFGSGLQQRLARKGIAAVMTAETTPDEAVAAFLASQQNA